MTEIFFDHCIGSKMVSKIRDFIIYHPRGEKIKIDILSEHFPQNVVDSVWIPQLNKDSIIMTADWGTKSGKDDKLPKICRDLNYRCVIMSKKLHNRKQFYKVVAILYCWDDILELLEEPPGIQYILRQTQNLKPYLELRYNPLNPMQTKNKRKSKKVKKEEPLKISGTLNDVLKVAVSDNPKPKK